MVVRFRLFQTTLHFSQFFIRGSIGGTTPIKPREAISGVNYLFHSKHLWTMSCNADLELVKSKAEQAEKILSDLQGQIERIKKAAVKQAGLEEEKWLTKENEKLKREIESIKAALIMAEIENGVCQVHVPSKDAVTSAIASIKDNKEENEATEAPMVVDKGKKEVADKGKKEALQEAKQAEEPEAGGKKAKKEGKPKAEDGGKPKKAAGDGGDNANAPLDISRLDLRVGKIVEVEKHPDADTLYVEQVDVGEGKNRTIVSGLVKHVPIEAMRNRIAVFLCNLKPVKMRGIASEGMIMCACSPEKTEILVPPADASIGDRVTFEEYPEAPDVVLNPKKKIWETLKPDVRTNKDRVASYKGAAFTIKEKGVVVAPTLADAQIS